MSLKASKMGCKKEKYEYEKYEHSLLCNWLS